jgi:hypothetical protein
MVTLEEWTRRVVMALRRTQGCDAARAVLAATSSAGHDLDGYDTTELVAQWVAEALDPGGLRMLVGEQGPARLPAFYRLHGLGCPGHYGEDLAGVCALCGDERAAVTS